MKKKLEELPVLLKESLQSPKNKLLQFKDTAMKMDVDEVKSKIQTKIKELPDEISEVAQALPEMISSAAKALPGKVSNFAKSPPRIQIPDISVSDVTDTMASTFQSLKDLKVKELVSKLPKSPKEVKESFFSSVNKIKALLSPKGNEQTEFSFGTKKKKKKGKKNDSDKKKKKVKIKRGEEWRYDDDGNEIYDENGNPLYDEWGNPLYDEYGNPLYDEWGRPLYDEEGNYLYDEDGNYLGDSGEKLDELEALKIRPGILRKSCVQCNHRHHEGKACHVFVPCTKAEIKEKRKQKKKEQAEHRALMEAQRKRKEEEGGEGGDNDETMTAESSNFLHISAKQPSARNGEKKISDKKKRRSSAFNLMNMFNQNHNYEKDKTTGEISKRVDPQDMKKVNEIIDAENNDYDIDSDNSKEEADAEADAEEDYTLWLDDPADIPGRGALSMAGNQLGNQFSKLTELGSEGINMFDSILTGDGTAEFDKEAMKANASKLAGNLKDNMLGGFSLMKD